MAARLPLGSYSRLSLLARHLQRQGLSTAPAAAGVEVQAGLPTLARAEYDAAGFDVLRQEWVAEMASEATLLRHRATGAEVMSVINDDENKTFSALFKTPPKDSTGIAHILEHSVLCGSRDYPLKEPFVELLKSSQQTFLNAMTYPDRTVYPVASCNLADFYNLVDVYLNAVFFPRAAEDPMVLAQEGWHYEKQDSEGGEALRMSGVVYNEMKGVYSDPDSVMMNVAIQSLSPDNTYGIDSGGDPTVIPQLTFDQFRDTWAEWYHPSNGRFWFSGDDPPAERLAIIDKYLSEFAMRAVDTDIPLQQPAAEPKVVRKGYEVSEEGEDGMGMGGDDAAGRAMVLVSWMLHGDAASGGRLDAETALAFEVLNSALMGTAAAPLRKALDDSGLGSQVIGGGLDDDLLQPYFMVGLKGVAEDDSVMQQVQQVVLDVLAHHAEHGFEDSLLAATMNTFEFTLRENNTGSMPRGLVNMLRSSGAWVHEGGDGMFENLKYEERLQSLKAKLGNGEPVFEQLLQRYLLSNSHRVTVEMVPDASVGPARVAAETAMVAEAGAKLGAAGIEQVIAEAALLQEMQHAPDPPEVLAKVPHLSIEDMPLAGKEVPTEVLSGMGSDGTTWLQHDLATNGIVYVNVAFELGHVAKEDVPLLGLFASCLKQNGLTTGEDFVAVAERIGATTGGVGASIVNSVVKGQEAPQAHLMMQGKAMSTQAEALGGVMADLLLHAELENQQRVATLVGEMVANMESSVLGAGHAMCMTRLNASLDLSGWMDEQLGGVSALHHLRQLQKDVKDDWPAVHARLQSIQQAVVHSGALTVDLTADASSLEAATPAVLSLIEALPAASSAPASAPFAWGPLVEAGDEAFLVPTQVNYVAKGGRMELDDDLYGTGLVLSKLLGTTYLWDKVRVVGGAYGVFGVYDWRRGVFNYVSYRDPKLGATLATYDGTADFVMEYLVAGLDEGSLTKAVVSTIGEMDSPMLPDVQGMTAMLQHMRGEESGGRQARRSQVLGTSADGFARIAEALKVVAATGTVKVVGSAEAVNAHAPGFAGGTERLL